MINKKHLLDSIKEEYPFISEEFYEMVKGFPEEPEIDFDDLYNEWCKNTKDWSELRSPYDQARSLRDFLKSKNLTQPQVDMDALRNDVYSEIVKSLQKTKSCPECGCKEYLHENDLGNGYRVCKNCKQEWWTDVDYSSKPFDIPVKKTWTLKKEYYDFAIDMLQPISLMQTTDKEPKHKQYYDLHEEPDYSKIPKGSIVEIEYVGGNMNKCGYVNGITNKSISIGFHVLYSSGNSTTINFDQIESIVILKLAKE